jgi:hypothetical protein
MRERCAADPDLSDVGFCIVQFDASEDGTRTPRLHFADDMELLGFEALDAMVRETYEIWSEILEERDASARRSTGTRGPLL